MALARARRERGIDYWPGFVDALSTLILGIVFLLSVFVIVQFFLSQEVTGKDTALQRLNAQIAQLTEMLSLEKIGKVNLEDTLASLRANLAPAESERDRLKGLNDGRRQRRARAGQANELAASSTRRRASPRARWRRSKCSTSRSPRCAASLPRSRQALEASESKDKESQARIADLGQRLNLALAQRVQELSRFRSDFFGRLRAILGNRPDIRVVGDRFVFQSEVFFDAGAGHRSQVRRAAPNSTSSRPRCSSWRSRSRPTSPGCCASTATPTCARSPARQFRSNWELSAARAISVVQYLIGKGISPQRLVAAGFGEFQPLDAGQTEDAFRRNRRIELKLTER